MTLFESSIQYLASATIVGYLLIFTKYPSKLQRTQSDRNKSLKTGALNRKDCQDKTRY